MIVFSTLMAAAGVVISWFSAEHGIACMAFGGVLALVKCATELETIRKRSESQQP